MEEEEGASVIRINMNSTDTADSLLQQLAEEGICKEVKKLRSLENTWLLLDDAQNAYYDRKFDPFWHFVVEGIAGAGVEENLFVVVAATYDLSTPDSPADFSGLEHIEPNVKVEEVKALFAVHAQVWCYENWSKFEGTLVDLSKFSNGNFYHIGVTMAGIRMLDGMRKPNHGKVLTEEKALDALRKEEFTRSLDRCFRLPDELPEHSKDRLLDVVVRGSQDEMLGPDALLAPFIRAGLLTKTGQFSNLAAR